MGRGDSTRATDWDRRIGLVLPGGGARCAYQVGVLRGYAGDPCDTVPAGHDPDMWRMHNGCNG